MTCIVGLCHKGSVFMGGDSAAVSGWDSVQREDAKVFLKKASDPADDMMIGFTDSFRMGQLLQFRLQIPNNPLIRSARYNFEWMATEFVDAVRKLFTDYGWQGKDEERESGGSFLVSYRTRLYAVHSDYQVELAADGYSAVGCGRMIALGSLYSTKDSHANEPEDRVTMALNAAAHHSAGVRPPYKIIRVG